MWTWRRSGWSAGGTGFPIRPKYIDFPKARYGLYQVDRVLIDGHDVGISHDAGYITNEQVFASLASLVPDAAEPGTEVVVVWGRSSPEASLARPGPTSAEYRRT